MPVRISVLDLSHNNVGPETTDVLAEEVLRDPRFQLQELHLENCRIGNVGAIKLADQLHVCDRLRFLDLRDNGITKEGATEFSKRLVDNHSLVVLLLCWNKIGSKGGLALANALKKNRCI